MNSEKCRTDGTDRSSCIFLKGKKLKKLTIGIIAHVDSGKTTLSEALLYLTGTIRNFGRVDKGASFLDDNDMERRRGITIYSKQARFSYGDSCFTLIDTPGHADFSAEMERALQVLDYAILLISASDGIKGQTETLWKLLAEYKIPVFVFFNKMDQDAADKVVLFQTFKKAFASEAVDFTNTASEDFFDMAAMCSEEAMDMFLETGVIEDQLISNLIRERKLFPCFFGSALKQQGVEDFIKALDRYTLMPEYPETFGGRVFKILRDTDGSRLTLLKVTGGVLKNKTLLPDGETESKINQIRLYNGNKYVLKDMVEAGEICALSGLKESFVGQGFGLEEQSVLPLMVPILCYRVLFPNREDPVKVLPYFKTLEEENPELKVSWDEDHCEISVCVMGEVQLEILTALLKERFSLKVQFDSGEVMYRETISKPVIGVGHFEPLRHYAEVHLLMEPIPRGSGLSFAADVSSDMLAKNWQRLILTHLAEKRHKGVLTGAPVTDIKFTIVAGKAHLKHTEGGDFRQAVYRAVRQGLMMTDNVLLEPYYRFTLEIPSGCVGRALTDLNRLHAEFKMPELDPQRACSIISGRGPVSQLKDYPRELAAYTQGQGHLQFVNDGYDICQDAERVILQKGYDPQADIRNTPDSVFCAHGSGFIVPYDQVYDYMHLSLDGSKETEELQETKKVRNSGELELSIGTEEVDAIIAGISRSNGKEKKTGNNWKRKYGEPIAEPIIRSSISKMPVFAIEDAEYIVVDAYNVIFAWPELTELARENIDSARDALIDTLSNFQSMTEGKVIAVFDAYRVKGHATERMQYQGIQIIYTGEEETADQFIEKYTNTLGKTSRIAVVTSDGLEQIITRGNGCMLISSRELKSRIAFLSSQLKEKYDIK